VAVLSVYPSTPVSCPATSVGRRVPQREVRQQRGRRVHVRVAVDAAEAQELGVREARDQAEDALLLG
jgi:hypothetical protein